MAPLLYNGAVASTLPCANTKQLESSKTRREKFTKGQSKVDVHWSEDQQRDSHNDVFHSSFQVTGINSPPPESRLMIHAMHWQVELVNRCRHLSSITRVFLKQYYGTTSVYLHLVIWVMTPWKLGQTWLSLSFQCCHTFLVWSPRPVVYGQMWHLVNFGSLCVIFLTNWIAWWIICGLNRNWRCMRLELQDHMKVF